MRLSSSISLPASVMVRLSSSLADTDWSVAVGASLTGVTVMDTVAGADVAVPSEAVKLKVSSPLKLALGV